MTITCVYTTTVILPARLHDYLIATTNHERSFENALSTAIGDNLGSGSNIYSGHEEWAEYSTWEEAKRAETRMLLVIKEYDAKAVEYFRNNPSH